MSEEDPESSTPEEKDINSESLSHQSVKSMDDDEEEQPDDYTNYPPNQEISDKNEEIIENENNEIVNGNILGENDDKYIAMIEGLEDELYIEQYITKSLKKDSDFNEEVNKLKTELNNKNNKLEQLKLINKKQENTLIEFRNKLKKEKTMNNKVIINNENSPQLKNQSLREVSKNEAMNNAIKNKDSDLTNVLNKMNYLKKENEDLKKKIYQIENNYTSNHINNTTYEDSTQKNLEKIKFLQTEKRLIEKQLVEHNKCIEEQNIINKEYNNLKNELRLLKINNQDIKTKIKEFEKKILNIEINDINNSNSNYMNYNNNISNLILKKKNNNNVINRRTPSIRNTTFSKTLPKVQNKNILPIISIQPLIPNISNYSNNNQSNKSILSEDFLKKIKHYFNENENDYFNLIEKINNIENNTTDNYAKLKKYNTQVGILDKINVINFEGKENEGGIKIMNQKLNLLKDENIQQNKKIEELNKHLDNIKIIEKEKDNEINALLNKINSMKNNLKLDNK